MDPTVPLKEFARCLEGVNESMSCNQSAFKIGKKAFFYTGPQAKRFKAMFKLKESIAKANRLSLDFPDRFEVGKFGWVTARFTAEEPLDEALWQAWLLESYEHLS